MVTRQVFKALTLNRNPPYVYQTIKENKTEITGVIMEILKGLSVQFGIRFNVSVVKDNSFGSLINGTWSGLIGALLNNETDLIAAPVTLTYQRSSIIDLSVPFEFEPIGVLFRTETNAELPFTPKDIFRPTLWLLIFITAFVTISFIHYINRTSPVIKIKNSNESLLYSVWFVFGVLVNQCVNTCLISWSSRLLVVFWRIGVFLIISIYVSGLTAVLTSLRLKLPFTDFAGFTLAISTKQFKACAAPRNALYDEIVSGQNKNLEILRDFFLSNPNYASNDCVQKLMDERNVGFIAAYSELRMIQYANCNDTNNVLILLEAEIKTYARGLAFPKNSIYSDSFSLSILNMIEGGLIDKWKDFYIIGKSACEIVQSSKIWMPVAMSLSLYHLKTLFIVLLIGLCLSVIILLGEKLIIKRRFCLTVR